MAPKPPDFVDHYEILGCSPDSSAKELKHAYHEKLREWHPDKRRTSIHGLGHEMTEKINAAWAVLSSPEKREAYDLQWKNEKKKAAQQAKAPKAAKAAPQQQARATPAGPPGDVPTPQRWFRRRSQEDGAPGGPSENSEEAKAAKAETCRREGNDLYKRAQDLSNAGNDTAAEDMYKCAIARYSMGIEYAPSDHRLRSNRALCYGALKEWARCKEDAVRVTQLCPCFMKGWFMLAKSYWKEGASAVAIQHLEHGLKLLPMNDDLIKLQAEILRSCEPPEPPPFPYASPSAGKWFPSRNPSPCNSPMPPGSREPTPTSRRRSPFRPFEAFAGMPRENNRDDNSPGGPGRPPPAPRSKPSSAPPQRSNSMPPGDSEFRQPVPGPRPESWRRRSESIPTSPARGRSSLGRMAAAARKQVDAAFV